MFFGLKNVETHPLYQLQGAIRCFFEHCVTADQFDMSCFPEWFQKVLSRHPQTLKKKFEDIAEIIHGYSKANKKHILEVFDSVNDVERLCRDKRRKPKSLTEEISRDLETKFKELFQYLYEHTLERKKLFGNSDSSIRNHFRIFRDSNAICPFCGIEAYPDRNGGTRANYDHYLLRSKYYFAAINFNNLIPMCYYCNTTNKGAQDILFLQSKRRLVFYPYAKIKGVELQIVCRRKPSLGDKLGEWTVNLKSRDNNDSERVGTWIEVFQITKRLEARIQENNERWMKNFVARRFAETACDDNKLRKALYVESKQLEKRITTDREAVLEGAYIQYVASKADKAELIGYCEVAATDYNTQMAQVGANLRS
jgi:hypothetical protein